MVHIHKVDRMVHGNGIDIKVYGELKIAAGEIIYAYELKLNTLEVLCLTPMVYSHQRGYMASKYIVDKSHYDNYATIDVWTDDGNHVTPGSAEAPSDGSIWLDFIAEGE